MTLQLRTKPWLSSRHCCVALTDWDMDQELKLGTTSDQLHHGTCQTTRLGQTCVCEIMCLCCVSDSFVRPSPWLWVSPGISCPIQYSSSSNSSSVRTFNCCTHHLAPSCHMTSNSLLLRTRWRTIENEQRITGRQDGLTGSGCDSLRLSTWPRPPVNYCILIGLALRSSSTGSLKVQQIYSFTREHFPFFVTAPDGWKNTIRHNLCFNSSFRKTCTTLGRDGKRKSCLWHLTTEGERRLRDDVVALSADTVRLLHRSMARPGRTRPNMINS
uniref:Forkhead box protein N5-like n=1 Tax=Gouania willdenowi TaxID=441366 RepID=A0A8C5CZY3_GOUWI